MSRTKIKTQIKNKADQFESCKTLVDLFLLSFLVFQIKIKAGQFESHKTLVHLILIVALSLLGCGNSSSS